MSNLLVCKENSNELNLISLETYKKEVKKLQYEQNELEVHSLKEYKGKIIVVNSKGNNIGILDEALNIESEIYVGSSPKDLVVFNDKAYVICSESNSIIVTDLINKNIEAEIPCGNYPHNIILDEENKSAIICNMYNSEITIIDLVNEGNFKSFRVGDYPTKCMKKDNELIVCESYIGEKGNGKISRYDLKSGELVFSVIVGKAPVDICYDNKVYYVSNMCDGSVSILDSNMNNIAELKLGGMPQDILCENGKLCIIDSYRKAIVIFDEKSKEKRIIDIGMEPTAMILQKTPEEGRK